MQPSSCTALHRISVAPTRPLFCYPSVSLHSSSLPSLLAIPDPFQQRCHVWSPRAHGCHDKLRSTAATKRLMVNCSASEPLKVILSGAPASGKGTQCVMIAEKFGLVHISTGDLLRDEVSSGTKIGNHAKEYMNMGRLVPDDIVTAVVTARLSQADAKEKGWLLDGYPRSFSQARSLEDLKIKPDIYIVLDVPDEILVKRCTGRRLDSVTRMIYHLENLPPNEQIIGRLVSRPDDTEEKVKSRLEVYKQNAAAVSSAYSDVLCKIDGNRPKEVVFKEISQLLSKVQNDKEKKTKIGKVVKESDGSVSLESSNQEKGRGIPTRLNNVPHSKEIRKYFYDEVLQATQRAINDGRTRLKAEIIIPELNPEMDVYRIGTLLELVRVLALSFADDGKRVKVCVQGSMGEGALVGMPLQLAGSRKILELMDWGDYGAMGTFISIGSIGAEEVDEQDDMYILIAPQNTVENCIIDDLKAMTVAAGKRPVILINPRLKDIPGSSGVMQTTGRDNRLEFAASFQCCYLFRLLYYAGTQYPIMGALRMSYPCQYGLYKRVDEGFNMEKYMILSSFPERPNVSEINDAFQGKGRARGRKTSGIWGFLSDLLV